MLTTRGVALCAIALASWALGRFLGVDELYVISGASVALVALAVVATRVSSARIAVRRSTSTHHAHRGERVPIDIALRNDGRLPASLLLVEDRRPAGITDDEPGGRVDGAGRTAGTDRGRRSARFSIRGLRPRYVAELRWHAVGRRRGRFTIGPVRIRLRDPFGLAERSRRYRSTDEVIVFPAVEPLSSRSSRGIRHGSDTTASQRAFHRGDEFHTMRAYIVGDDLRYVHWPSTAHRGTLMIRQHELPWQARAVVYVDARGIAHSGAGDRATLERAVSAAASVLTHLQRRRYELRLVTDAGRRAHEVDDLDTALVRLAELTPTDDASPVTTLNVVERAGNGLLVAIVRPPRAPAGGATGDPADADLVDHAEFRALQRAGAGYRTRVALVIERGDADRCHLMARLLRVAGWQAAVAPAGEPLADVWHRAMVGADIGRLAGTAR